MHAPEGAASRAKHDVLEIGGRLRDKPSERLIATAFADELANQLSLFDAVSLADLAHTLMMMRPAGPIPADQGAELLRGLLALHERPADFAADPALGDVYTNREAWLNAHCAAAGWLGVSRARREAVTCGFHIAVRAELLALTEALADAALMLTAAARRHKTTLFPDYTYLQAAQPTSFGHYLLGFGFPLERHMERALDLHGRVNQSPAGGGSANGSIAQQDRAMLARLMGFDQPAANTRDAMWQADHSIEAAGLAVNALVTLDRLGEDLMVYTSQEFSLVRLSDRHSRASKIMPQKKNPFALSYLRGIANHAIGVQTAIAASMRTPSGQMDNRMTAYAAIPAVLRQAGEAARLTAEVIGELQVDKARAKQILEGGELAASDLAEHIMLESALDYRQAHKVVGALVRELRNQARGLSSVTPTDLDRAARNAVGAPLALDDRVIARALDAAAAVKARTCLGGAAPARVGEAAAQLSRSVKERQRSAARLTRKAERARSTLLDKARVAAG